MRKFTESQIKRAISARDKETRADAKLRNAMSTRMQAGRRQGEKALSAYLKKTGFDFAACNRISAQQQAEMHTLLKETQKSAIKRSSSRKKELAYGIENWRKNVERFRDATLVSTFAPDFEVVDTPFLIWPSNNLELDDSHVEPWNNTAKVRGQWHGSGSENLRFIFVWQNPTDKWIVVNVESNLAVNGACDLFADGGYLSGSTNWCIVQASLYIWEWWNSPPTVLSDQATQLHQVLWLTASGGGFLSNLGGGNVSSKSASGIHDVRRTLFTLPPNGVAVFEVALEFFYENIGGGTMQANFASGDFGVKCPAVVIGVLS